MGSRQSKPNMVKASFFSTLMASLKARGLQSHLEWPVYPQERITEYVSTEQ